MVNSSTVVLSRYSPIIDTNSGFTFLSPKPVKVLATPILELSCWILPCICSSSFGTPASSSSLCVSDLQTGGDLKSNKTLRLLLNRLRKVCYLDTRWSLIAATLTIEEINMAVLVMSENGIASVPKRYPLFVLSNDAIHDQQQIFNNQVNMNIPLNRQPIQEEDSILVRQGRKGTLSGESMFSEDEQNESHAKE